MKKRSVLALLSLCTALAMTGAAPGAVSAETATAEELTEGSMTDSGGSDSVSLSIYAPEEEADHSEGTPASIGETQGLSGSDTLDGSSASSDGSESYSASSHAGQGESQSSGTGSTGEAAPASQPETEDASTLAPGTALLSDYGYEAGSLTEEGWTSDLLRMCYTPSGTVSMGLAQNEKLKEYHGRFGDGRMVSNNEMVAVGKDGSYVQLAVEVNPNHEPEEDILARFAADEELELLSDAKELEIAGKKFLFCTGVFAKEKYLLAVSNDVEDMVIAVRVRYSSTASRKELLSGFAEITETEAH